jgi:hypothetical protein
VSTRLFVIPAREARVAAVLRRGPTKQVLLLRWNLADDTFEAGQWFNGRVYERRCDLSPAGDRFIYFAASHRPPYGTWTAVSRLPCFTALAVWPKGDAWGGGGLFRTDDEILVNHQASQMVLKDGLELPSGIKVSQTAYAGGGEDAPIYRERLRRDGWICVDEGTFGEHSFAAPMAFTASSPETWTRPSPTHARLSLRARTLGIGERQGSWYAMDYDVLDAAGEFDRDLGRIDWADWDTTGDLLIASDGKLRRWSVQSTGGLAGDPRVLIDLSGLTFERHPPPPEATRWNGPAPKGIRLARGTEPDA